MMRKKIAAPAEAENAVWKPRFVRVQKTEAHAKILFDLLQKRHQSTASISHCELPSWDGHLLFVLNHPYRAWYLVEWGGEWIGTIYLLRNNCMGIHLAEHEDVCASASIHFLTQKYRPLAAIQNSMST
jgi:hypothetical protein